MVKLSNIEIDNVLESVENRINERSISDVNFNFSIKQETRIKELYNLLMKEQKNINKTKEEQEEMVEFIADDILKNANEKYTIARFSDDKNYFNYFSLIMENTEATNFMDTIEKLELPTTIFKGLKLNRSSEIEQYVDGNKYTVRQIVSEDSPFYLIEFKIFKNDKLIYDYSQEINGKNILDYSDIINDVSAVEELENQIKKLTAKRIKSEKLAVKKGKPQKSKFISYAKVYDMYSDSYNIIEERENSKGRTYYINAVTKRFVSNPNR